MKTTAPLAVIFDWGGTLVPWWSSPDKGWTHIARRLVGVERADEFALALAEAEAAVWRRAKDSMTSGTLEEIFEVAGLPLDPRALGVYEEFWEPHTLTDPDARPLLRQLKEWDLRIGVLSNTIWSRERHGWFFERDGLAGYVDAAVYTSETAYVKPHPDVFIDIADALGTASERCVFVGDRPYDDIWGAARAGMRTILVPHSDIPDHDRGPSEVRPDAVVDRLLDVASVVGTWTGRSGSADLPDAATVATSVDESAR